MMSLYLVYFVRLYVCDNLGVFFFIFFFKQKTAYEMRISDWSSDVCSSDLHSLCSRRRPHMKFACPNRALLGAAAFAIAFTLSAPAHAGGSSMPWEGIGRAHV